MGYRPVRSWIMPIVALLGSIATLVMPARNVDNENQSHGQVVQDPNFRRVRVGLVFDVGGRGDKSFNDAAYRGLARARSELAAHIEYVEPSDAEDRVAALRLFAARNFELVIGVGYMFSRDVDQVAVDYPNVKFACVDYAAPEQGQVPRNVVGLRFREEEGTFLVGAIAALSSRSSVVGFVGGMDIPLIRRFQHGYEAGVRHVCPHCRVEVGYAGSTPTAFRDPAKGEQLALAQFASGADVIFHASGTTGHGVFVAAHRMHRLAIGVDSDQYEEMPDVVLTSMLKRVDVAVFETIRELGYGRFPRGQDGARVFGVSDGGIDFVSQGEHARHLSREVVQRAETLRQQIARGELQVPLQVRAQ